MQHPVLMAAFAAALTALSFSVSATETVPDREREQADKQLRRDVAIADSPPVVGAPIPSEILQAARKPDETPFSKIKILPSF